MPFSKDQLRTTYSPARVKVLILMLYLAPSSDRVRVKPYKAIVTTYTRLVQVSQLYSHSVPNVESAEKSIDPHR
jgi:hypothetical protein